jgi:hypothetical protein
MWLGLLIFVSKNAGKHPKISIDFRVFFPFSEKLSPDCEISSQKNEHWLAGTIPDTFLNQKTGVCKRVEQSHAIKTFASSENWL